ncbi:hypothetical protein BAU07_26345 (plasmid) [Bordetella flabilis]|uniref:Uncharacterized protein n=1 Tax=Bordetella flabilis TaxID=463014 RepID=A0A193GM11_9BORD|nr:hypothetical protein BAU07_26345 [Bordetella flabilis]
MESISELEVVFGTTRFLPAAEEVPSAFHSRGSVYSRLAEALFYGGELPKGEVLFRKDLAEDSLKTGALVVRFATAHLRSFEPKHEHKIAGVAYLLSQLCEIRESI